MIKEQPSVERKNLPEQIAAEFKDEVERIISTEDNDFIISARGLLRTAMISLRHKFGTISGEKTVHHLLPDPVDLSRENPLVVLGTGRCSYVEMGGCAMCSFGEAAQRKVSQQEIDEALDFLVEHNNKYADRAIFNINVIGSFFNDSELSPDQRSYIIVRLREYKNQHKDKLVVFVTESRFEDISEAKIQELRNELGRDIHIEIGFGVESTNDLVREAIIGKGLDPKWKNKLELLKKYDIDYALHIMFGLPFLTEREQIADTIQSVKDCLDLTGDNDRVLLMVMNKKPGTLVDFLARENKYKLPSVVSAAKTVIRLSQELYQEELKKVSVFGLVFPEKFKDFGAEGILANSQTDKAIMDILLNWRGTLKEAKELERVLAEFGKIDLLKDELQPPDNQRLKRQIIESYVRILAKLYCEGETDKDSAKDKLKGILDISSQMGGSLK